MKIRFKPSYFIICLFALASGTFISCEPDSTVRDGIRPVTFKATGSPTLITEGESITYIDSSLNVMNRSWVFEGGDVTSSNAETVEVSYTDPSFAQVDPAVVSPGFITSLSIEHNDGSIEENEFRVLVYPKVIADFSANKTELLFNNSVEFTNLTKNRRSEFEDERLLDSYSWEFEGGIPATSTAENPTVNYTEPGVYSVTLTAHRETPEYDAVETKTEYITVLAAIPLVPDFTANTNLVETGETVTYTDASTGEGDTWAWTFEGGTPATSTEQNPTVTYNTAGMFDVELVLTRSQDGESQSITKTDLVTVNEATGPFCNTDNLVACGNNDGEQARLADWSAIGANASIDRKANISVSNERSSAGNGSIKYLYSEPGAGAFTNNILKYDGKRVKVETAGSYTLEMDVYAEILSGGTEFVYEISLANAATGVEVKKQFFRSPGGSWNHAVNVMDLNPGEYFVHIKMWNPPFHADLNMNLYLDEISVTRN